MAPAEQSFTKFPNLPTELRRAIWRCCLPLRVYELDGAFARVIFGVVDPQKSLPCSLHIPSALNVRPPVITRVCRESRELAFEEGSFVDGSRLCRNLLHGLQATLCCE